MKGSELFLKSVWFTAEEYARKRAGMAFLLQIPIAGIGTSFYSHLALMLL